MLRLKQNDRRWGLAHIGNSAYTLGTNGCLITALCMILSKFYPERGFEHYYTPLEAAKDWTYVPIPEDPDPRYLLWSSIENSGFKLIWRCKVWKPDELVLDPVTGEKDLMGSIVLKYSEDPNYGVVLRVRTLKGGQHWVASVGRGRLGWVANDPWLGVRLWTLPFPYVFIDGFAIVKKTSV